MGNRSRPHRTKTPLLVAASAITRACDPKQPSRTTVLRLLGDALHAFEESQLVVDEIKARAITYTARDGASPAPPGQLDVDARVRAAHEQGARALFSAVSNALIKLPTRAGPLRRRAIDLLHAAGRAAGPAVVMQAAGSLRSHISSLKRLTWSDAERGDFEVVCAILTLADISNCAIAGRDLAKDSVIFLLGPRVRQKCKRGDLAFAIAHIVQSFPVHAPPDDRLVDNLLELALSSTTLKQGSAGVGSALLAAIVVPHLVSRGSQPADDVTATCGRALRTAPTSTERAMWAVAMARASVTARRSMTYQIRKYGNVEAGAKFPRQTNSFNRLPPHVDKDADDSNPRAWVANETFEEALRQVAKAACLAEGRVDSSIAVASLIRMWSVALPESIPIIVPQTFAILLPDLSTVAAVSALVDGIWLGLLKDLKPSRSSAVFENLLPALSEQSDLRLSAALHICSALLLKHGRQCICESGLTLDYGHVVSTLIKRSHEALDVSSHFVRMGGVRLMSGLTYALPRTCSQLLMAVLQNLRIADLTLTTKQPPPASRTFASLTSIEQELSSILGNSAALSLLITKISSQECSVPSALARQCSIDIMALLRPHQANQKPNAHGVIASCIRRRAGWGLLATLLCSGEKAVFEEKLLNELLCLWKEELGFAGHRGARNAIQNANSMQVSAFLGMDGSDDQSGVPLDELLARSSTRSAALLALCCALKESASKDLEQCARVLVGACCARIVAIQTVYGISATVGSSSTGNWGPGYVLDASNVTDPNDKKRQSLKVSRVLMMECSQLVQCMSIVPPRGDAAELCYYIAICLGEEAQRELGESEASGIADPTAALLPASFSERSISFESALSNHRSSLCRLFPPVLNQGNVSGARNVQEDVMGDVVQNQILCSEAEKSWMFSMQGSETLVAEDVLVLSAVAIAAIVSEDLTASGSLVESLSSAKPGASFSAVIALEMARRLSRSDLSEINRGLAVLQVLAKRSLGVTGGTRRGAASESKTGRLYTPHVRGDGNNFGLQDMPGAALQRLTKPESWLEWARSFSDEGYVVKVPFHDFHTRALGVMYNTRSVSAAAHRELGRTGGATLWVGLMHRVISIVKDNMSSIGVSQSILLANGIAVIGALLEVVPESRKGLASNTPGIQNGTHGDSADLDDISDEAIRVLAEAIENENADVQAAAALALSNCSRRVAVCSERLLGGILKAWAQEKGEFSSMGQLGRCTNESDVWFWCFSHVWRDMGIRSIDNSVRFFSHDSSGIGSKSASLVAGAIAVLSSCRLHWRALTESEYFAVTEISTELVQWAGGSSQQARAAGLYGMTALWAARIDAARARRVSKINGGRVPRTSFGLASNDCSQIAPVLPTESFSLKEPTRINSAVGPFLDEILYEALAPYESAANSDELQMAATAAVAEMIRGIGIEETCSNLPRLPEVLFATVENGSAEARRLLDILVTVDAKSRPKYWFGLCRAICLQGDRLHYGPSTSVWDVSYQTRAFCARVAAEAVDSSLAACKCRTGDNDTSSLNLIKHSCAYSFLRKITAFAIELSKKDGFDFATCSEGCKLIQRVAFRTGSVGGSWSSTDPTLHDFRDVWDFCLSAMEELLVDSVPHMVVMNAGTAVSELLVSFLRLWNVPCFVSARAKVASCLDKSVGFDLRRRFVYSDQGEEVGINATFALLARYAKVVTALRATFCRNDISVEEDIVTLQPSKTLFLAVIGDFISMIKEESFQILAERGGALTAGMVSESQLHNAMILHIAPIVLGAISCVGNIMGAIGKNAEYTWANPSAAGVRMAEGGVQFENASIGCFVWLLKHEHVANLSSAARLSFTGQSHEALISLFCTKDRIDPNAREAMLSFAQWSTAEFLTLVSRISTCRKLPSATQELLAELTLGALREIVHDRDFTVFDGCDEIDRICGGIGGLTRMIRSIAESMESNIHSLTARTVDTIFLLITDDCKSVHCLYSELVFQQAICECLTACLKHSRDSSQRAHRCLLTVRNIFRYGYREESLPHLKIGMAVGIALHKILGEERTEDELVQRLLTPAVKEKDGSLSELTLGWTLRCFGTEQFIIDVIRRRSTMKLGNSGNARSLVYHLGMLGLSTRHFCIPAGLRIAIAAIRVDVANSSAINRVGLILYSICLSKLVRSLPTRPMHSMKSGGDLPESASFLLELAAKDSTVLGNIVSLLRDDERKTVKLFLLASEVGGEPTNAYHAITNN